MVHISRKFKIFSDIVHHIGYVEYGLNIFLVVNLILSSQFLDLLLKLISIISIM